MRNPSLFKGSRIMLFSLKSELTVTYILKAFIFVIYTYFDCNAFDIQINISQIRL